MGVTGNCEAQFSCVHSYEICRLVRAFDPNFAAAHLVPASVDAMNVIEPLAAHADFAGLKQELPLYLAACQNAPAFDKSDVTAYSDAILSWWRQNGKSFPAWASAATIVFALSPNSAACERVFSMLKRMFSEQQIRALGDYIRAALMLTYNGRNVG